MKAKWLSPLTLWLLACALPAAAAENVSQAASPHLPLWKVEGPTNAIYLLGSIHCLKPENYPLPMPMEAAFSNAAIAVFEVDMTEMEQPETQLKLMGKSRLPEGQTLPEQLSSEVYSNLLRHAADAGLPEMMLTGLKPAAAAILVVAMELRKLGFDPDYGVDEHFFNRARKEARRIVPLETVDFQIDLATDFSKDEGELLVKSTLADLDDLKTDFPDLVKAWKTGDADALEKLLNDASKDAPSVFKRLVTDRNGRWVPKLEALARGDKPAMVIVGAGHLVGKDGVVEQLRKRGLKVTQQ